MAGNEVFKAYSEANPALAADIVSRSRDSKGVGKVAVIATAKTDDPKALERVETIAKFNHKPENVEPSRFACSSWN